MPVVSNIVDSSRKAAFIQSVGGVIDSAGSHLQDYILKHHEENSVFPVTFTCDGTSCSNGTDTLVFKGAVPVSGNIVITEDGVIAEYITYGKYCAYGYKWDLLVEKNCAEIDVTKPVITGVKNGKVITLTMTDVGSGVDKYCVNTTDTTEGCSWVKPSNPSSEEYTIQEAGTRYFFVRDKKGNISDSINFTTTSSDYCQITPGEVVYSSGTSGMGQYTVINGCAGVYRLEVWGSSGGSCCYGGTGGKGGYASGAADLNEGDTIYASVGGQGSNTCPCNRNGCEDYSPAGAQTYMAKTNTTYANTQADDLYLSSSGGNGGSCYRRWDNDGNWIGWNTNGGVGSGYVGNVFDGDARAGNVLMPKHDGTTDTMTGNSGNGYVKITYVGATYTIIFDPNGGSVDVTGKTLNAMNNIMGDMPVPTKIGEVFWGWYTDTTYKTIVTPTTVVKENMHLYARWGNSKNKVFEYLGRSEGYRIPETGTYKFELWGAQGGTASSGSDAGGKGGYSTGTLNLTAGDVLYVTVGGRGGTGSGGYNGGGSGGTSAYGGHGGGGGGATHVTTTLIDTGELKKYNNATSSVLIVAAGGGGASLANSWPGAGGGLTGGNGGNSWPGGASTTTGGTQAASGGAYGSHWYGWVADSSRYDTRGGFGYGGTGGSFCKVNEDYQTYPYPENGGGGGGYYGGGGGNSFEQSYGDGGGGGSSYIGGVTNGETIAGNASMPTHDGTSTMTGNSGNGYAKITLISN